MQNVNCLCRVLTGERKARKNYPGDFSPFLSLSFSLVPLSTRLIFPIHRRIRFRACISISRWPQSPLRMRGLKNIHVIEVTASILSCAWKLQSFPQNKERQASKYQNAYAFCFSDWSEADLDAILSELQQLEKKEIKRQQNGTKGEQFIHALSP